MRTFFILTEIPSSITTIANASIITLVAVIGISLILLAVLYKVMTFKSDDLIVKRVHEQMKKDNHFLTMSKKRYSVRQFKEAEVTDEQLALILEAGRIAPTAKNTQPQRIFVLKSELSREKIEKCLGTYKAPLVILVCVDVAESAIYEDNEIPTAIVDASIVTTQMMNEATSLGLGSVWLFGYNKNQVIEEFALPPTTVPISVLAIGYPFYEEDKSNRYMLERRPLNETVKII